MKQRSAWSHILLLFRGMAMGAVDVVPGVSGGTIALITGIYEELIFSIKSFNAGLFQTLYKEGLSAAWKKINGNFLLTVVTGILISIFSLARGISWLIHHHPMLVWAFFFGLILGSIIYLGEKIRRWTYLSVFFLFLGTSLAYYITVATPATGPDTLWFIFIAGSIAFCALVLPGISGAFILVLLGKYEYMLNAVSNLNIMVIFIFGMGGVAGVIAFSNVIGWLFKKHPNATMALLSGFMIGSLNKLWPWKQVLETRLSSSGQTVPLLEKSISPWHYATIYGEDPQVLAIVLCALAGLVLILSFTFLRKAKTKP